VPGILQFPPQHTARLVPLDRHLCGVRE
jgi:hypothetical protein